MKQNKFTFKDTNITVDWIGFKFQNLDNFVQTKLAEYLFKMDFLLYLIRLEVVQTEINAEIMEFFQDQQHQQVVSTIIINRIRIMNRP